MQRREQKSGRTKEQGKNKTGNSSQFTAFGRISTSDQFWMCIQHTHTQANAHIDTLSGVCVYVYAEIRIRKKNWGSEQRTLFRYTMDESWRFAAVEDNAHQRSVVVRIFADPDRFFQLSPIKLWFIRSNIPDLNQDLVLSNISYIKTFFFEVIIRIVSIFVHSSRNINSGAAATWGSPLKYWDSGKYAQCTFK